MHVADKSPIPIGKFIELKSGIKLHYHEVGKPSSERPTVVFLHGSGPGASGYSNFKKNFPYIAEHGYHCLVVDYIGYGLSDKPADMEYSSDTQVDAIHQLVQQSGAKKIVPLGNSLGGLYGLQYTLTWPDEVEKLIMMAPGGMEDPAKFVPSSPGLQAMAAAVKDRAFDPVSFRRLLTHIVHDESHLTPETIAERQPIALTQPSEVFTKMTNRHIWERLGEIKAPALGFWGLHDKFLPVRHAMLFSEYLKNSRMIISSRAGHWFMIEESDYLNRAAVDFLKNG
jgi:4,5:9,10-diseco-3-hydroxy-5,9,17-trioxoandrosta-1(10),2-diene-4-oate hydrolase